jgi:hypothetical protein
MRGICIRINLGGKLLRHMPKKFSEWRNNILKPLCKTNLPHISFRELLQLALIFKFHLNSLARWPRGPSGCLHPSLGLQLQLIRCLQLLLMEQRHLIRRPSECRTYLPRISIANLTRLQIWVLHIPLILHKCYGNEPMLEEFRRVNRNMATNSNRRHDTVSINTRNLGSLT